MSKFTSKHIDVLAALLASVTFLAGMNAMADERDRFEARVFKDADNKALNYRLLKPKAYEAGKKYPMVIFLHGAGERGNDNAKQLVHGMKDYASDALMEKYPCFVMAPQCPEGKLWVDVNWSSLKHDMPSQPAEPMRLTIEALGALQKEFSIDATRLYVTGLSMGGYGTWDALQRYPDRFAAAVPICGGGDVKQAKKIAQIPIWAFHGDKDTAVPVERTRTMIAALKEAGGMPKYTEYPDVGHDSWTATYKDPALHEWMFAQRLKPKTP